VQAIAKGVFLVNLTVAGAILALIIYQVPQPWRGALVAWLLFMSTLGFLILRFVKHHYDYKSLELSRKPTPPRGARRSAARSKSSAGELKVVRSEGATGGRFVVR
jgi:hypothetical protein